ncbi:manganese-dependent inorganic pyrophosphatase [Bhargavaea ullalensis]|uniref:Probable manganese-dependent inorganic pyrophosphatase n=1 Tax=Bhargavaea ullalensis TaxID=1265685 RepID=A0ABV2GCR1_9BACL
MAKVLVFGHQNPDTDSITAAIAYAHLKKELGMDAEAVRLGEVNDETAYALEKFGFDAPRLVKKVAAEAEEVILVDHNERQQSAEDIADVRILEVVDHHRIANFETADPLYYRAEPVGCTATILNKLYKENGVDIPKDIAGLMLSAIVSDSLLFKSPTFTEEDRKAADELASIADVDAEEYGLAMLKAGADLSKKTLDELINMDAKEFEMGGKKVVIAQVNTVDVDDVLGRKEELEDLLYRTIAERELSLYMLAITDILENDSTVLVLGSEADAACGAFHAPLENNLTKLKGVVSRKKQIVPVLTAALSE